MVAQVVTQYLKQTDSSKIANNTNDLRVRHTIRQEVLFDSHITHCRALSAANLNAIRAALRERDQRSIKN